MVGDFNTLKKASSAYFDRSFNAPSIRQILAKPAIPLQVPFPAHRGGTSHKLLGVKQVPGSPARRARPSTRVMAGQAAFKVGCPTDVGPAPTVAGASQYVNEARHIFRPIALTIPPAPIEQ